MASSTGRFRLDSATPQAHNKRPFFELDTHHSPFDFISLPPPHFGHPTASPLRITTTPTPSSYCPSKRRTENEPLHTLSSQTPSSSKRAYKARRTNGQKLESIFQAIADAGFSLGDFCHFVFRNKDDNGNDIKRSHSHSMYVTHFLQGQNKYTPAMILDHWFRSPEGRVADSSLDVKLMYSTSTPYTEIRPARAALSAFAAQLVESKLVKEAKRAVRSSSGLHATSKRRGSQRVEWADIGTDTVASVREVIKECQPLLWHYANKVAQGKECANGVQIRRPTETVCTHVISTLNFTRNNEARLLPLARGLLYFAFSAPADLMSYGSRIGDMPAYNTVYNALKGLASHEARVTEEHARDPSKWGFMQIDNVQNYLKQRDHRIGRVNKMNVGLAATYCELDDVDISAADFDDKARRVAENKRARVSVQDLLAMIDHQHLDTVFSLHWLRVLVNSIPELSKWKEHVSMLFREKTAKLPLPAKPTKIHPLASSGKNETVTTELKDAISDFLGQLGQREGDYLRRIIPVGGDGLTFQKFLEIQNYLQFHPDLFQSLKILDPVLASWHTEWTDLSRVYETHWDGTLSHDPSSIGHSATRIGRPAPANLKKVDYYTYAELMYLVLEVRILDCWRNHFKCIDIFGHFSTLAASKKLPEIEDLIPVACKLHRTFSSTRAIYHALDDTTIDTDWTRSVPLGSSWTASKVIEGSKHLGSVKTGKKKKKQSDDPQPSSRHTKGDRVLANSITFMRDALMSRELSYAIAEGDPGRVFEVMKILLFTFAGSSHTKYTSYLLETVCRLELESGATLREAILKSTLVNLTGHAGAFTAADFMQEFFNRLLEAVVEKKGVEYGDTFIREVISRNLHHFARIKVDLRAGVGLEKRGGSHCAPHVNPEVRTLLQVYHEHELHHRRPGRVYRDDDKDDFDKGLDKLQNGKLKKWILDTTLNRGLLSMNPALPCVAGTAMADSDSDEDDLEDVGESPTALGYHEIVNGQMVFQAVDDLGDAFDNFITEHESHPQLESEPESDGMDLD